MADDVHVIHRLEADPVDPVDVAVAAVTTPVGELSVAVTRAGLAAVRWCAPEALAARTGLPLVRRPDRTDPVIRQVRAYFRGELRRFDATIDWGRVPPAPRAVLVTLYETVPFGASVTYGGLAARSGTAIAARGIGAVMGANPWPVVVPCHRVLAADGLGGYSGGHGHDGLEIKRWLLAFEGVLPPTLDWNPDGLVYPP